MKNKETIVIYDVVELNSHSKPVQIAKQISNFNIISMKFSPIDPYLLHALHIARKAAMIS